MWYLGFYAWIWNKVESSHIYHPELEYQQRKGEIGTCSILYVSPPKGQEAKGKCYLLSN